MLDYPSLTPHPQEFVAVVSKTNFSQPLGVDVDVSDDTCLTIERVHESGALPMWNRKNPATLVQPGDVIVDVNGVRGDAELMTLACTRQQVLELRIRRDGLWKQ